MDALARLPAMDWSKPSLAAGVTPRADDTDWTHGDGPDVTGPAIALVMAMGGRKAALDDLCGPGVDMLRTRT